MMSQKSKAVKALTGGIAHLFKQNKVKQQGCANISSRPILMYDKTLVSSVDKEYVNKVSAVF